MFKGFQERILGQLFRILLILHDAYNQDKYLLTVFIQKVLVERSFPFSYPMNNMCFVVFHFVY